MWGMVTQEMVGVDIQSHNLSGRCQPDDHPVVAFGPFPAAFPSIHPFTSISIFIRNKNSAPRLDKVFFCRKEIIRTDQYFSSEFFRGKISKLRKRWLFHNSLA